MFWGLVLEPGKRYSTTVEKSFHVSKAALDCSSVRNESEILSVMLETEGSEALLCNLCKQKGILQEDLDLNFMAGDRLTFECRGYGRIHLSGYLLPDEEDDLSGMLGDEEESEEEEEDTTEWSGTSSPEKQKKEKRKQDAPPGVPAKKKKMAVDDEEGDSDSDQDDESDLSEGMEDEDVEDEEDDEDDEMNDKEEDESEDEEETVVSTKENQKQQKQEKNKTPNKQNVNTPKKTPVANGVTPKEQKSNKKTPGGGEKSPNTNTTPKHKKILDHGVVVKEIRIGNGPPAKNGKPVSVYYVGKLKEGNKVFDKSLKGDGFKFKLGKGEVIKGWDIGVQGMRVGGKRVIHCPPEAAYGAKGVPPKIPPNSSLIFEVELKNVH